jgi:hypothetical protein
MATTKTERIISNDATRTIVEETYTDSVTNAIIAITERTDWKPGSAQANVRAVASSLDDAALKTTLRTLRGRMLDIREGYGKSAPTGTNPITGQPYAPITTANAQQKAVQDLADAVAAVLRVQANMLKSRLPDPGALEQ